jgi:hypothetical protein
MSCCSFSKSRDLISRHTKSAGTARPSFVASALNDLGTDDESNEDVHAVKLVAGGIFGGKRH